MRPHLRSVRREVGSWTVLELGGEIDLATAPQLRTAMRAVEGSSPSRLVLDLSDVGFVDSSGLRVLIDELDRIEGDGGDLVLTGVSPQLHRLLGVAGVEERFRFADSVEEAAAPDEG